VIRSLSHGNANHVQASMNALTGHGHPPQAEDRGDFPPSATDFPPFGAVLSRLRSQSRLPTWVQVGPLMRRNNGTGLHGQLPGFLGARYSPLWIDRDLMPPDVRIEAVASDPSVPVLRLSDRGRLLEQVDEQCRGLESAAEVQSFDGFHRRALDLLSSPAAAPALAPAAGAPRGRAPPGGTQGGPRGGRGRRLAAGGAADFYGRPCRPP